MIRASVVQDTVETYCDQVLSGELLASEMVRKAVERYQSDLSRQRSVDFPFYFDFKRAESMCTFFPLVLRHSIGEWSGQPFLPSPFQQFINWNLFGWKRLDGKRRFRRAFVSMARKNGKSTWCAGLAIALGIADKESVAQVFVGATKNDQARIIFDEVDRMMRQSPHLAKRAKIGKAAVQFPDSGSYIKPLASDRPFDGLNPHCVLFDELHAWTEQHRPFYNTMSTGGASRTQPMQIIITTAGDDKSLIYNEQLTYVRGVADGSIKDESQFVFVAEIDEDDDPLDPKVWIKANPNLGVSVKEDYLQDQAIRWSLQPSVFVRYHANRSVSSTEGGLNAALYDSLRGTLSDWKDADAIGAGVDLGGRDDLASIALCAKYQDGDKDGEPIYRYEAKTWSFISSETNRNLTEMPFAHWLAEGKLIRSDYVVSELKATLMAILERFGVSTIAYDPRGFQQLGEDLEMEGYTAVKMPQSYFHYNEPINEFHLAVKEKRFLFASEDDVLRWCVLNMVYKRNPQGDLMPDKSKSKEKIDAAVAMLMAFRASWVAPERARGSLVL